MLIRSDAFRDIDRFFDDLTGGAARARTVPLDAYRRGDDLFLHFDLPGVDPDSIDLSVENDVLRVTATRRWPAAEGDEVYVRERPQGEFSRQVILGRAVDGTKVSASFDRGVLTVRAPIAAAARRQRIAIGTGAGTGEVIDIGTAAAPT
jgi:HSP20 family protein